MAQQQNGGGTSSEGKPKERRKSLTSRELMQANKEKSTIETTILLDDTETTPISRWSIHNTEDGHTYYSNVDDPSTTVWVLPAGGEVV